MKMFFRVVSFLEGTSYLLLLFVAVPIKYWMDDPQYVKLLGMPHGLLICHLFSDCFFNKT